MALQKRRLGRTRIHHRRSAWARKASRKPLVQSCPNCESPRIPHRVCMKCGFYGGEIVMKVEQSEEE
ncbi:MAG: 50S ribosomal protein L32 [Proteobacteria bacterium]|nr:50S ribosomal protein L32 [Pseudomonadota bacterium]